VQQRPSAADKVSIHPTFEATAKHLLCALAGAALKGTWTRTRPRLLKRIAPPHVLAACSMPAEP
jgi:hypothetical protein